VSSIDTSIALMSSSSCAPDTVEGGGCEAVESTAAQAATPACLGSGCASLEGARVVLVSKMP
jgi:hypothetical protein